jgi:hypothetical protein
MAVISKLSFPVKLILVVDTVIVINWMGSVNRVCLSATRSSFVQSPIGSLGQYYSQITKSPCYQPPKVIGFCPLLLQPNMTEF